MVRTCIFLAGVLALVGCSSESKADKRFFRPPIPLISGEDTFRQPIPASTESGNPFEDLSKTEGPESGRILVHGNITSLPFPIRAVKNLEVGESKQDIGDGYQIKTEVVQISEWGAPPEEFLTEGEEKNYEQTFTRHLFLDPDGEELEPGQAVLRFPRVGGSGLFPVRRSGSSWYQHSFKRQVALWFRISGDEESNPESVRIKALGAVDHRTGFPIPGAGLFGMGEGEFRIISSSPKALASVSIKSNGNGNTRN